MMRNAIILASLSSVLMAAGAEAGQAKPADIVIPTTATVPQRLKPAAKDLLLTIKEAGDAGFMADHTLPEFQTLLNAHWLMVNNGIRTGNTILAALTPAGKEKAESYKPASTGPVTPRAPLVPIDDIVIENDIPIPEVTNTRRARMVYPFEKLTAKGQSFFYPAPEGFPADKDYAASKQGTVAQQNRKSKEAYDALPVDERPAAVPTYKAFNDTKDGVRGFRIFRMS